MRTMKRAKESSLCEKGKKKKNHRRKRRRKSRYAGTTLQKRKGGLRAGLLFVNRGREEKQQGELRKDFTSESKIKKGFGEATPPCGKREEGERGKPKGQTKALRV